MRIGDDEIGGRFRQFLAAPMVEHDDVGRSDLIGQFGRDPVVMGA